MAPWPNTGEDKQLDRYWRRFGGTLYTEVCLGKRYWGSDWWNGSSAERRFDGVLVHGDGQHGPFGHSLFRQDAEGLRGKTIELIEVKRGLGEPFLGQALVGRWMFEQQVAGPYGMKLLKTVALHRHRDPAMLWVADKLNLDPARDDPPPTKNAPMQDRTHYTIHDDRLARLSAYREAAGGRWFTRMPLGGPHCGVQEWDGACETWIPFVRLDGERVDDIRVYEDRHRGLLLDAANLELVVVSAKKYLGRGPLGVVASHALMFERRYGRAFDSCTIVCGVTDPEWRRSASPSGARWGFHR